MEVQLTFHMKYESDKNIFRELSIAMLFGMFDPVGKPTEVAEIPFA